MNQMPIETYISIISGTCYTLGGVPHLINNKNPEVDWGREWKEALQSEYQYWMDRHGVASLPDVWIAIRPVGFWADVIKIHIRSVHGHPTEVHLSWSTGGIDPAEDADISKAARHFALALTAAAQVRDSIIPQFRAAELAAQQAEEV